MACDIFKKQVERTKGGNLVSVKDTKGNPSKLYQDIVDYVVDNGKVFSEYLDTYIKDLIDKGHIKPNPNESGDPTVEGLNTKEYALAIYSRIFTPTFREDFKDWEGNKESPQEPDFQEVKSHLFEPSGIVEGDNTTFESYDIEPLITLSENLDEVGDITVDQAYQELTEDLGYNIKKSVLKRLLDLRNVDNIIGALKSDINEGKFSDKELHAIYSQFGVNEGVIDRLRKEMEKSDVKKDYKTAGAIDGSLDELSDKEKVEKIKHTLKKSIPGEDMDAAKQKAINKRGDEKGMKVKSKKSIRSYFNNVIRSNVGDLKIHKGSANVLMKALYFLYPTIKASGLEVTLHTIPESYSNALEENGRDFIEDADSAGFINDNQIHIWVGSPVLDGTVAAHEIIHPIVEHMFINNRELYNDFKSEIEEELKDKYSEYVGDEGVAPSMEAIIQYISEHVTRHAEEHTTIGTSSLAELIRWVWDKLAKFLGIKSGEDINKLFENTSGVKLLNDLITSMEKGGVRFKVIRGAGVRFSKSPSQYNAVRNAIVSNPELDYNDRTGEFKNVNALKEAAKELGIPEHVVSKAYQDLIDMREDVELVRESTLFKRLEEGFVGRWDKRRLKMMRDYLSGRLEEVLPDYVMKSFFNTYRSVVGDYSVMLKDILNAESLPNHVKFFLLDRILAHGHYSFTSEEKRAALEAIEAIRKDWGRLGRYMRDELSLMFGGHTALQRVAQHLDESKEKAGLGKMVDRVMKAFSLTKEEAKSVSSIIDAEELMRQYKNYTIDEFEVRTTLMKEALTELMKMGVTNTGFVKNQKAKTQALGSGPRVEKDPSEFSNSDWVKITKYFIILSKGNIGVAEAKFADKFPDYTNKFQPQYAYKPDRAARAQRDKSREQVWEAIDQIAEHEGGVVEINENGNTINDGAKASNRVSINNPLLFAIKEAIKALHLDTNKFVIEEAFKKGKKETTEAVTHRQAIPLFEAAVKLKDALSQEKLTLDDVLQSSLDRFTELIRENALKDTRTKSDDIRIQKLRSSRNKIRSLLYEINLFYGENNKAAFEQRVDRGLATRIREKIETHLMHKPKGEIATNKRQLVEELIYDMKIPPNIAQSVAEQIRSELDKRVLEERKKIKELEEDKIHLGTGTLGKLEKMFREGVLDRNAAFSAIANELGLDSLSNDIMSEMISLKNRWDTAKTSYDRNRVHQEASLFLDQVANDSNSEVLVAVINQWMYDSMLSSPKTVGKAIVGTMSIEGFKRFGNLTSQMMLSIWEHVFNKDSRRFKFWINMMASDFAFSDYKVDKESGKWRGWGHGDAVRDVVEGVSLMSSDKVGDTTRFSPLTAYFTNILKKRYDALKKAKKGNIKEAIAAFAKDLISGDLGSKVLERKVLQFARSIPLVERNNLTGKVELNIRRGIRFGSLLMPLMAAGLLFTAPISVAVGTGAFVALNMLTTNILAKMLPLADYFMSHNIKKYTMAVNAFEKIKGLDRGTGAYKSNKKFWNQYKVELGIHSYQLSRINEIINEEFQEILDEAEMEEGRPLTAKETQKLYDRTRVSRAMQLQFEYANPEHLKEGIFASWDSALIGVPAGRVGRTVKTITDFVNRTESSSNLLKFVKILTKFFFIPFGNVMGNILNQAWAHSPLGLGQIAFQGALGYSPKAEKRYSHTQKEWIVQEMGPARYRNRITKAIFGTMMYVASIISYLELKDDEGDDNEDKAIFRYVGVDQDASVRITGPGTGNWAEDGKYGDDYKAWAFQYKRDDGTYETFLNYNEIPIFAPLALIGNLTDREILRAGQSGLRTKQESVVGKSVDMGGMFENILSFSLAQTFNQNFEVWYKSGVKLVEGDDPEFGLEDALAQPLKEVGGTLASTAITPNWKKDIARMLRDYADLPLVKSNEYSSSSVMDKIRRNDPHLLNPSLVPSILGDYDKVITDPLDYPIYTDFEFNQPFQFMVNNMVDIEDSNKARKESSFYKLVNKYPEIKEPSYTGMWNEINTQSGEYGGAVPKHMSTYITERSKPIRRELLEDKKLIDLLEGLAKGDISIADAVTNDHIPSDSFIMDTIRKFAEGDKHPGRFAIINKIIESVSQEATERAKVDVIYPLMESMFGSTELQKRGVGIYNENPQVNEVSWSDITKFLRGTSTIFGLGEPTWTIWQGKSGWVISSDVDRGRPYFISDENLKDYYKTGNIPVGAIERIDLKD